MLQHPLKYTCIIAFKFRFIGQCPIILILNKNL